jgi:homocysteine S-methyltransferase
MTGRGVPFRTPEEVVLTDGGTGTTLAYKHQFPLRHEATFEALDSPAHAAALAADAATFARQAFAAGRSVTLDTITYRASSRYFDLCGTAADRRDAHVTRRSVALLRAASDAEAGKAAGGARAFIVGCVGSMGDAYRAGAPTVADARAYHRVQVAALAGAVDFVAACALTNSAEAAAVAVEAADAGASCAVLFTLEDGGRLACGEALGEAVAETDRLVAAAGRALPAYFGVNCVHPARARPVLRAGAARGEAWVARVKAFRGNASRLGHGALEGRREIDEGDAAEWARDVWRLRAEFPALQVIGGCCGTGTAHQLELARCAAGGSGGGGGTE